LASGVFGRLFTADDNRIPGGHPVVVLSGGYWRRRFGGDPHIVGQTIRVNAHPMTIIGITPAEFPGIEIGTSPDIRVPIVMQAEMLGFRLAAGEPARVVGADRRTSGVGTFGKGLLSGGRSLVTANAAQPELDAIFQRSLAAIPGDLSQERHVFLRDGSRDSRRCRTVSPHRSAS